jgi:hypothetical protein
MSARIIDFLEMWIEANVGEADTADMGAQKNWRPNLMPKQ